MIVQPPTIPPGWWIDRRVYSQTNCPKCGCDKAAPGGGSSPDKSYRYTRCAKPKCMTKIREELLVVIVRNDQGDQMPITPQLSMNVETSDPDRPCSPA